jgi:hypothetical protein
MLGSKMHFRHHVDNIYSHALKLLGVFRFITYAFSSPDSLKVIYIINSVKA